MNENSHNNEENICFICEKLGSGCMSNSGLGEITKITRGLPTLRSASFQNMFMFIQHVENKFIQII